MRRHLAQRAGDASGDRSNIHQPCPSGAAPTRMIAKAEPPTAGANAFLREVPPLVISRSYGESSSPSPMQTNLPFGLLRIDSYSRLARTQGGSLSSSATGLLLAMILAPGRACPRALLASSETSASSPQSDQLSQERPCQEQWCGAISTSYSRTCLRSL